MSENRKDDHIRLALKQKTQANDFDKVKLKHQNLAGIDMDHISLKSTFLGYDVPYPFYINAMTGGTKTALDINKKLAQLAQHFNIPIMVGSQMITFKNIDVKESFEVVKLYADKTIRVANINANATVEQAVSAIKMIDANGLAIHLNILQELQMSEGDRNFCYWKENIKQIVEHIDKPIIVKEVGFGLSTQDIDILYNLGVKYVDISGRGGTDFGLIEAERSGMQNFFNDFGSSTVDILEELESVETKPIIYASGGIRNASDVIKALVLGAKMVGISKWFLELTTLKYEEALVKMNLFISELKMIMAAIGANEINQLHKLRYDLVL